MGGAEKILLEILDMLNGDGYETVLYTLDRKEDVGLAYDTAEKASLKIRQVMVDEDLRETLRRRSMERSKVFSVDRFRGEMRSVLESLSRGTGHRDMHWTCLTVSTDGKKAGF